MVAEQRVVHNDSLLHYAQGIAQALEVAADTVEELSKGSAASQDTLESHCKTFLETVKV